MPDLTRDGILRRLDPKLDESVEYVFFPDFDHGYHYHVDQRLSAYGDGLRWVIVIEQVSVNPRGQGIETTLYFHGNAVVLPSQPGWGDHPIKTLSLVEDGPSGPLPGLDDWASSGVDNIRIRGEVVPLGLDDDFYRGRGIEVHVVSEQDVDRLANAARGKVPDHVLRRQLEPLRQRVGVYRLEQWHVARGLVPEHRELLLATEKERREGVPAGLPRLLQIDEWRHPRFAQGELPSTTESFPRIADVLATSDVGAWRPALEPNTHWRNWPNSGGL
jgi:hypothetical protein